MANSHRPQVFLDPSLAAGIINAVDNRIEERVEDFRRFGVKHIWIVDPKKQAGWDLSSGDWIRATEFSVAGTPIKVQLPELFASID